MSCMMYALYAVCIQLLYDTDRVSAGAVAECRSYSSCMSCMYELYAGAVCMSCMIGTRPLSKCNLTRRNT